ncbi:glycosyltransferase family 4 protein [bacterium]|nr:glycosyltransferase family 4 protein [bacterium]
MRILYRSEMYPPSVGGMPSYVASVARGLAGRGHEVTVLTPRQDRRSPRRQASGGLVIEYTPGFGESPAGLVAGVMAALPRALTAARGMDILHTHAVLAAPPLLLASRVHRRPHVITVHTARILRLARTLWARPMLRYFLSSARHVFVVSRELEAAVRELVPRQSLSLLSPGVDTRLFAPTARPAREVPLLLCPRRLVRRNGVIFLLKAMPRILAQRRVELEICGGGPERERLEREARRLELGGAVRFSGVRAPEEMPRVIASADLVVIPSLIETTSAAALEAMASGVPVAASRVGALPDIVSPETGILFDPGNPDDLAEKVLELLAAPDLPERGRLARRRVEERWNLDGLLDAHLEVYQRVVGGSHATGSPRG